MEEKIDKKRLDSIQALRALAFLGIFLQHAGSSVSWSGLGVSVFYVLSGFLMIYNYYHKEINVSLKENIIFSIRKIKKLYPLHIITMGCMVLLSLIVMIYDGVSVKAIIVLLLKIILNVTLLQTWVPKLGINVSLNGVAWYLSVTMFLYFVFPFIHRFLKNRKNDYVLLFIPFSVLVLQLSICATFINLLGGSNSEIYIWLMYCFPIFRLGDFWVGCCIGCFYLKNHFSEKVMGGGTTVEIGVLAGTIMVVVWMNKEPVCFFDQVMHNWTTIYIPLAVIWIVLFVKKLGWLIKVLNNQMIVKVGNISAYTFLIHYVVIQYCNKALNLLNIELNSGIKILLIILEFIVTIIATLLYIKIEKSLKGKRKDR